MPEKRFEDKLKELLHLRSRQRHHYDQRLPVPPPLPPQTEPMLIPDAGDDDNDLYDSPDTTTSNLQQPATQPQQAPRPQLQPPQQQQQQQPDNRGNNNAQYPDEENDPIVEQTGHFPVRPTQNDIVDPSLIQQPSYDDNNIQLLNDTAADESLPVLNFYISQLSHLGDKAQGRLIARAASFQSKNQVFSNIVDTRDYQMAQDDFQYAQILSKADFTAFDMNTDYFTAEAIMEAQFNIRLRRSRKALNLSMFNTQRQESVMSGQQHQEENQKIWQKVPFLGGGGR